MNIERIMTRQVETIGPDSSLREACEMMRRGNYRHLPVIEQQNVVGIISDRDLALGAIFVEKEDQQLGSYAFVDGVTVRELMSPCPAILRPTDAVTYAIELAVERKLGAFPVMDRTDLVGIVTVTDLLGTTLRSGV